MSAAGDGGGLNSICECDDCFVIGRKDERLSVAPSLSSNEQSTHPPQWNAGQQLPPPPPPPEALAPSIRSTSVEEASATAAAVSIIEFAAMGKRPETICFLASIEGYRRCARCLQSSPTALYHAIKSGSVSMVYCLMYWFGCDPNVLLPCGSTALHLAARYGHREMMELLLDGVSAGDEARHDAYLSGQWQPNGEALLKRTTNTITSNGEDSRRILGGGDGDDADADDGASLMALGLPVSIRRELSASSTLPTGQQHAAHSRTPSSSVTPTSSCCEKQYSNHDHEPSSSYPFYPDRIRVCDIEARNCTGATPLFTAVYEDYLDVARLLLSKGADPNAQNYKQIVVTKAPPTSPPPAVTNNTQPVAGNRHRTGERESSNTKANASSSSSSSSSSSPQRRRVMCVTPLMVAVEHHFPRMVSALLAAGAMPCSALVTLADAVGGELGAGRWYWNNRVDMSTVAEIMGMDGNGDEEGGNDGDLAHHHRIASDISVSFTQSSHGDNDLGNGDDGSGGLSSLTLSLIANGLRRDIRRRRIANASATATASMVSDDDDVNGDDDGDKGHHHHRSSTCSRGDGRRTASTAPAAMMMTSEAFPEEMTMAQQLYKSCDDDENDAHPLRNVANSQHAHHHRSGDVARRIASQLALGRANKALRRRLALRARREELSIEEHRNPIRMALLVGGCQPPQQPSLHLPRPMI